MADGDRGKSQSSTIPPPQGQPLDAALSPNPLSQTSAPQVGCRAVALGTESQAELDNLSLRSSSCPSSPSDSQCVSPPPELVLIVEPLLAPHAHLLLAASPPHPASDWHKEAMNSI
ncbi:hypothetical protein F7725_009068 [Dissostichus mawsoni]|uniref:Uncharacterized protein n=1 Tax=Dissostichus mawsoni TaxID=36200 RepID=A0A7J5Z7Z4_DISMA|nr:hypothetical protein F7725_009068 [Dissostichus mawsoni]